jgi:hypothetical protein
MRAFQRLTVLGCCYLLTPVAAYAQASIAGLVKDSSGAVLPGVTVEASSDVLIEKVRSAVTDGTGQYKIIDLRPGSYTVTFTLTGFNTVKREDVQLIGSNTATVNADMAVGSVAETLTVTGAAPTVDVQNTARGAVIDSETQAALPTGRSQWGYAVLVPGVTLSSFTGANEQDVGGTSNMEIVTFTIHGSRPVDQRTMVNGLTARNLTAAGWASNWIPDMGTAAEVTYDYSSGTADQYGSGLTINIIPKEGGNSFRGSVFATAANGAWQSNNYTSELQAQGLGSPNTLKTLFDVNPAVGGPLWKDHLWFFATMRWQESAKYVAGANANLNLGDLTKWTYVPDPNLDNRGLDEKNQLPGGGVRLTWQATPRNKIGFSYEPQARYWRNALANQSPETYQSWSYQQDSFTTVTYTSPITNKLLFDARWVNQAAVFVTDCAASVNPACSGFAPSDLKLVDATPVQDLNTGWVYRGLGAGLGNRTQDTPHLMEARASLSYVTGAHAMKFGFQNDWGTNTSCFYGNSSGLSYAFGTPDPAVSPPYVDQYGRSEVPVSLTQYAVPYCATSHLSSEMGIYAQDKWTIGRATINGGIRFDYFNNNFPAQPLGPTIWTPNRNVTIPAEQYNDLKDITPRVGLAYDLTGDGKTAIKLAWGKYMAGGDAAQGNPINNLSTTTSRSWTPTLPFGSPNYYTPQCDLSNPAANGDCGATQNALFGQLIPSGAIDPATYTGWGHRFWNQEFSVSIQREVLPRMSVDFGYFRRWFGNFEVVQNRAVTPADFTEYSIAVPNDPRLPRAGQMLGGFYEVNPAFASAVDNYTTFADNFGTQQEHWNGFDLTINARPRSGVTLQGGLSWGRLTSDVCAIETALPETQLVFGIFAYSRNDCHVVEPFQTQGKVLATYLVPKIDVQVGVTFQSAPGPAVAASYFVTAPQVGLPSFSAAGVRLLGLVPQVLPQPFTVETASTVQGASQYWPRANQLDLRFSKILRFGTGGRYRTSINFDMANALNSSDGLGFNSTYGASWQNVTSIMDARLLKLSAQFDF